VLRSTAIRIYAMIESCCDQLKRGKDHGFDGLTAELYVVLSIA